MKIQCPNCQHEGNIPEEKIPEGGASVNCPKCKNKFLVTKPSLQEFIIDEQPPPPQQIFCPQCGEKQSVADTCIKCSIVFAKYIKAQTDKSKSTDETQEKQTNQDTTSFTKQSDKSTKNVLASKAVDEKFCNDCGATIKIKAELCPSCGVRQTPQKSISLDATTKAKSKTTAILLAFFLGGFGAHKFYLNQEKLGVLYALFCWTFIPGIVALVETIMFLFMTHEDFDRRYN